MEIHLTAEQEAQISEIAEREGRHAVDLATEVFSRGLSAEVKFLAAVRLGQEAVQRGDYVDPSALWSDIEAILQP